MADPRRATEADPPASRANKAGALRWAISAAIVLAIGLIAWWIADPRGESPDLTPQHQPGYEDDSDGAQPPAVMPNQDQGTGTPPAAPQDADGTTQ